MSTLCRSLADDYELARFRKLMELLTLDDVMRLPAFARVMREIAIPPDGVVQIRGMLPKPTFAVEKVFPKQREYVSECYWTREQIEAWAVRSADPLRN